MHRVSRSKQKKSQSSSCIDKNFNSSITVGNNKTVSDSNVPIPYFNRTKRNAKSSVKMIEENQENSKVEKEQENKRFQGNKRKYNNESNTTSENQNGNSKNYNKENKKLIEKNVKKKAKKQAQEDIEVEEEYEVEKIVNQRLCKGLRQFLVRWKGYSEKSDTWESERDLNCDRLIEEFLTIQDKNNIVPEIKIKEIKSKAVQQEKQSRKQNKNKGKSKDVKNYKNPESETGEEGADETNDYEVEKIIEVYFKKDKKREFLIRWKGFTSKHDTWEPEENLNCQELIDKFMEKLEKIRNTNNRELRVNPAHTKRYTLTMYGDKRQSRRNANKERVSYFEYDDLN